MQGHRSKAIAPSRLVPMISGGQPSASSERPDGRAKALIWQVQLPQNAGLGCVHTQGAVLSQLPAIPTPIRQLRSYS